MLGRTSALRCQLAQGELTLPLGPCPVHSPSLFGCSALNCVIFLLLAARLLPWLSQQGQCQGKEQWDSQGGGKTGGALWPPGKPKAWSRECGSPAAWRLGGPPPALKMSVSEEDEEICSSQHFQTPQSCCFPLPVHLLSGSAPKHPQVLGFAGFCQSTRKCFQRAKTTDGILFWQLKGG